MTTQSTTGKLGRKPRPTTWNDVNKPECEQRTFRMYTEYSRVGRTRLHITCPFCDGSVTAFLWSISGGGKRCDCGAMLGGRGVAYKLKVAS